MNNIQNLQISKHFRKLSLLLMLGLSVMCATRVQGQNLTASDKWFTNKFRNDKYVKAYLNKIIASSKSGILVKDCETGKERIIETNGGCCLNDLEHRSYMIVNENEVAKVFRPGDIVAVVILAQELPDNEKLFGNVKVSAQDYYNNTKVIPGSADDIILYPCVIIYVQDRQTYYNKFKFDELKRQIQSGQSSSR